MKCILTLTLILLFACTAFARTSAAQLNQDCNALKAKGNEVNSIDRNSNLGFCLGYVTSVLDSLEQNPDIEAAKDFLVGDAIESFLRYAPQHYAEAAHAAIVNALIADGFLRHRAKSPQQ